MYSKWIGDVNVKCETIKLSEKRHFLIGGKSSGSRTRQPILRLDVRSSSHTQKTMDKLDQHLSMKDLVRG